MKIKFSAEECEALEGKEIDWTHEGVEERGIVAGCDLDVGITVVNKANKEDSLVCLPGPSVKDYKYFKKDYKALFNLYVNMIMEGKIVGEDTYSVRSLGVIANLAKCPFT